MLKASVIIPTKNEENYISKVLDSLITQDYPKDNIEILIVDAMSVDNTRKIIEGYQQNYKFIKILDNPNIFTSFAFNTGIKNSTGDVIIFMGAHTTYSPNYISTIVKYISEGKADCVGSVACTLPRNNSLAANAIALGLSSRLGVGNSYMRIGSKKVRYVDTASCPGYKKEVFDKIGLFNEKLARNQDLEFNLRLKKAGGKILLMPDIVSYYYSKSNLQDFFKHNFADSFWVTYPLKFGLNSFSWRHLVPLFFVLGLAVTGILGIFFSFFFCPFLTTIGLYLLANIYFSTTIAIEKKDFRYLFLMPITFACRHIGYGSGSIYGLLKVLFSK